MGQVEDASTFWSNVGVSSFQTLWDHQSRKTQRKIKDDKMVRVFRKRHSGCHVGVFYENPVWYGSTVELKQTNISCEKESSTFCGYDLALAQLTVRHKGWHHQHWETWETMSHRGQTRVKLCSGILELVRQWLPIDLLHRSLETSIGTFWLSNDRSFMVSTTMLWQFVLDLARFPILSLFLLFLLVVFCPFFYPRICSSPIWFELRLSPLQASRNGPQPCGFPLSRLRFLPTQWHGGP